MTVYNDWLEISTEGFAQRQADRKPEHLIKEVIQNALDATEGLKAGVVDIAIRATTLKRKKCIELIVEDNGPGISDPKDLRTVFSTGKTDSFLLRGRLGQGFKEILCLCLQADVYSTNHRIRFYVEDGQRRSKVEDIKSRPGTTVSMWLPWEHRDIPRLEAYVRGLIAPTTTQILVNGQFIPRRPTAHTIDVELKTELFQDGRWVRRERPGVVDMVPPAFPGEKPMIFEMGIPVQEIDWTQPYHLNVQMRIPMNPRRDAVAAGYLKDVFRQVLPVLMPKLQPTDLRDEWVSLAVEDAEPELRRNVVVNAFGENAVRSVPTMGKHDWDSDAREMGFKPIETALLPRGLREAAQENMQSSREAEIQRRESMNVTWTSPVNRDIDGPIKAFIAWLAGELVDMPVDVRVAPELAPNGKVAAAAWSTGGRLILNEEYRQVWRDPLDERFLGLLVHEVAHEDAAHHGDDFRREVERMAGKLAMFCLNHGNLILAKHQEMEDAIKAIAAG
jgi:hypothetical protein